MDIIREGEGLVELLRPGEGGSKALRRCLVIGCAVSVFGCVLLCTSSVFFLAIAGRAFSELNFGGGVEGFVDSLIAPVTDAGSDFLNAVSSEQYDLAYDMMSSDLQARFSRDDFRAIMSDFPVASWDFNTTDINNNRASLNGTLTLTNGSVEPLSMQFVEQDGWRVDEFDFSIVNS